MLAMLSLAQEPVRVKPGDILTVITANQLQYSGDFTIATDGSIQIQVLGQFTVSGKTVSEIQSLVQRRAREYVRDAIVSIVLKQQLPQFVFLVSEKVIDGTVVWTPGFTIRQLIAKHPNLDSLDNYVAKLFSLKQTWRSIDLVKLVRQGDETQNYLLEPGDVLSLLPKASKPVWVVGSVNRPGLVRLSEADGVSQAIALTGGVLNTAFSPSQITITLRRGEQTWSRILSNVESDPAWKLEIGDTVSVQFPKQIKVSVGGFVKRPGEVTVRELSPILAGIESSGGTEVNGTLERVLLFRKGEVLLMDLRSVSQNGTDGGQILEDGDFIYVSENKRTVQVFGFVMKPGTQVIPDGHSYHLSDALAKSEGLVPQKGTYRNAVVLRAGPNGKFIPTKYNFDRYMKDGDSSQNPEIKPGDVLYFDQISGTTIQEILRVLPSIVLLERLF